MLSVLTAFETDVSHRWRVNDVRRRWRAEESTVREARIHYLQDVRQGVNVFVSLIHYNIDIFGDAALVRSSILNSKVFVEPAA
jgi:hypothetical protein